MLTCCTTVLVIAIGAGTPQVFAQQPDTAQVIRMVNSNVRDRVERVLAFTDVERYSVYRGNDESHPIATMTARVHYIKGAGKTYSILSQTGSPIVQKLGLHRLIDNEKEINQPGNVERSWFTSANYRMELKPGGPQSLNGRPCYVLSISPHQKAPNLIDGRLWVDARDGSTVQVEGIASKSPSIFAGTTHMMRQYTQIEGFPMATFARAESKSAIFGRTVVVIEYSDYHLHVRNSD